MKKTKRKLLIAFPIVIALALFAAVKILDQIKIRNAYNGSILYRNITELGYCNGFCSREITLYSNGVLRLWKRDTKKGEEEKQIILSSTKLEEIKENINKSKIIFKNCNSYYLMDASHKYEINIEGKGVSFVQGYYPNKRALLTEENCSNEINQIEEKIGYNDWFNS